MKGMEERRKVKGMTQAELAEQIGTSQVQISNYERGKSMPSAQKLKRLAAALNCTVDELLR